VILREGVLERELLRHKITRGFVRQAVYAL